MKMIKNINKIHLNNSKMVFNKKIKVIKIMKKYIIKITTLCWKPSLILQIKQILVFSLIVNKSKS
jgi:hypothetical protein